MFLLDRILVGLPVAGLRFVLRQVANLAEREMDDAEAVRDEILDLHRAYEAGTVDDETYAETERALMARWRAARQRRGGA